MCSRTSVRSFTGRLSFAAALGALTGCAGLSPPQPSDPAPVTPEHWQAGRMEQQASVGGGTAVETWWTSFGEAGLDEAVETALADNLDVAAAAARVDAALEQARIAGAQLVPQVSSAFEGSRRRQNFIGLPIPSAEGQVLSNTSTTVGVSLDVSWEIDLWGRLRNTRAAGAALAQASAADLAATRLSLAGQVTKAWFALREAKEQVRLAQETLESRQKTSGQIRSRYERGLRSALDLRLALTNEANAEAVLTRLERGLDATRRQLQVLLSRYPAAATPAQSPPTGTVLPAPPELPPLGLPAELVARRPDLRATERRLKAAGLDVAAARAQLYPQLRLSASAGRLGQEIGDLADNDFSVWSLAEGLLQPLFQGGRLRAGVRLADARLRETAYRYAHQTVLAWAEVEKALAAETFLEATQEAVARAAEQAAAAEKLAARRYLEGLNDYLTVLETQRQATLARSQLITVSRQQLEARIDLHLALGGGLGLESTETSDYLTRELNQQ
ncbi:MAG: efflux transporter outer membrane subunit [Acidobacteriota bacterium]|nr:efflux transporter outer membrane subunit [Acidobacteriota bacterium]